MLIARTWLSMVLATRMQLSWLIPRPQMIRATRGMSTGVVFFLGLSRASVSFSAITRRKRLVLPVSHNKGAVFRLG